MLQQGWALAIETIPADVASKAILFFGATGVMKIAFSAPLKAQWPSLPSWFWAPCGVWEMMAFFLLALPAEYMKALEPLAAASPLPLREVGFLMSFAFLGGTSCATTALSFQPVPLFFTLATLVLVAVVAHSHGLAADQRHIFAYFGGYVAGLFFGVVLARPKDAKKKASSKKE